MAWNYTPPAYVGGATLVGNWGTVPVALADFEAIAQDIQHWGGNVDASGFQLVNLGAFQFRSGTLPASPTIGEIAVDSVTSTPKIWALGSQWAQLAPIELQRTMPGTVNNEVDIGSFVFFSSSVLLISVAIGAVSYSVSKFYVLPISFNATNNVWFVAAPVSSSGVYQGAQDFALDVNVNNSTCSLRLRNTLGALTPTATITIRQDGPTTDVFTPASGTSAVTAPFTVFGSGGSGVAPIIVNRTIPTTVNSEVDIGSFVFIQGAAVLWISVVAEAIGYSITKAYALSINFNATNGVWSVAQPVTNSGYAGAFDFALDVNVSNTTCSLRLRNTLGALAPLAAVTIRQDGIVSDIFTPSSGTSAVALPSTVFGSGSAAAAPIILNRTISGTLNNEVDIGAFTFTNGGGALWISVVVPTPGYSVTKLYQLSITFNATNAVWMIALPVQSTQSFSGNDFHLDINVNNAVTSLRLRSLGGGTAGAAIVTIRQEGMVSDVFTPSTGTSAVTAPTAIFGYGNGAVFSTAFSSVTQSLANNVSTAITFDTNVEDSGTGGTTLVHSTTTNTSRFTVPTGQAGRYHVSFWLELTTTGANGLQAGIRVNGVTSVASAGTTGSTPLAATVNISAYVTLFVGDYVELLIFQNTGGALTAGAGRNVTGGQILRIS